VKKVVYIRKVKFKESGLDSYVCLNEKKEPLYSSIAMENVLKFVGVYLDKMNVEKFKIIYLGEK